MKYQGSIKKRLIGIILFVTILTSFIGYSSFVYWYMGDQHQRTMKIAKTVALVLAQDTAKLIFLNEVSAAADMTSKLDPFENLQRVVLYTKEGKAVFQYAKDNRSFKALPLPKESLREFSVTENILRVYVDAFYQETHLGYVQLNIKIKTIWDVIQQNIIILLFILIFMILVSYLLATFYAKQFTNPILKLVDFLETIEFINIFKHRIKTDEKNEYGKLYEEVNTMLSRMELSQEEQKIAAVAFETQSGMTITDVNQTILQTNKAFSTITGYTQEEALGNTPSILKSNLHGKEFYDTMHNNLKKYNHWSGEIYNRHKDGTIFPEHLTIQSVLNEEGEVKYYVASFIDLTLQKESEKKLAYLESYDTLTGLANRNLLLTNIQEHLDKNPKGWGNLICFNLKDFKIINDAYGHTIGDRLLQQISKRVKEDFDDSSMIARVGADEFVLWYSFVAKTKDDSSVQSNLLAEYLTSVLEKDFLLESKIINPQVYIGIALYNSNDSDATSILQHAQVALSSAKKDDKNIAYFDSQAEKMALSHLDIYSQLLVAIKKEEFVLWYQYQYDEDGEIYAAEALIRWQHPVQGIVAPDNFIPIAEKTGLILPIGLWVIQSACKQLAKWQQDSDTSDYTVAINITAKEFAQENFVSYIEGELTKNHLKAQSLKVELTESILVENLDEVIQKMNQLKEIGVQISLDDFGTGYSSLQYLKSLPINQVKIDQSFVKNMHSNRGDIAIIKSVLLLSEALDFDVIAEGVETKEHYEALKELGCKQFQGYYFSRPKAL